MKLTKYIPGLTLFTCAAIAQADVQVDITGATAFRAATLDAIKVSETASNAPFKYAHDQDSSGKFNSAGRAIFIGTFPGVSGTTTIRCHFTGSVEGVRSLVGVTDPSPPTFFQASLLAGTTATVGGAELINQVSAPKVTGSPAIAFSDVTKSSTPYAGYSLQPTDPRAGVVVFTVLANKGSSITNVTSQQFRALFTNGWQPLSMFTGNENDTSPVFMTGRNDASGTRTNYLAETGFGISSSVKQYVGVSTDPNATTVLQAIQLVPAGGVNKDATNPALLPAGSDIRIYNDTKHTITQSAANASTVWGQDIAGNGGYNSGGTLVTDMAKSTSSVTVFDEEGGDVNGEPIKADLVTFVSIADAVKARGTGNGAVFCAFNGVKLDGIAQTGNSLTAADKAKVTQGSYTAWGYENMYRRNDITSGDTVTVYEKIKSTLATTIGIAGIPVADMKVFRTSDGGIVAP